MSREILLFLIQFQRIKKIEIHIENSLLYVVCYFYQCYVMFSLESVFHLHFYCHRWFIFNHFISSVMYNASKVCRFLFLIVNLFLSFRKKKRNEEKGDDEFFIRPKVILKFNGNVNDKRVHESCAYFLLLFSTNRFQHFVRRKKKDVSFLTFQRNTTENSSAIVKNVSQNSSQRSQSSRRNTTDKTRRYTRM